MIKKIDLLLVVHPTSYFDQFEASENINKIVDFFIEKKKPILTLVETHSQIEKIIDDTKSLPEDINKPLASNYLSYLKNIKYTQLVESKNGENQVSLSGNHIVVIGGYLHACLRTAVRHLIKNNIAKFKILNFYFPMSAIYGKSFDQRKRDDSLKSLKERLEKWLSYRARTNLYLNGEKVLSFGDEEFVINIYIKQGAGIDFKALRH